MFKLTKKVLTASVFLVFALFLLVSCSKTPSGKKYTSMLEDKEGAKTAVKTGDELLSQLSDVSLYYNYELKCDTGDKVYTMGTESKISLLNRGKDGEKGSRVNTFTALDGTKKSESFWLTDGKIYTKQYQTNFKANGNASDFLEYTAQAVLSADEGYYNTENFEKGTIYACKDGTTEIVFTEANDAMKNEIAVFIGLDKLSYIYTVRDVMLIVNTDAQGTVHEKHLIFYVDYYAQSAPNNVLTYEGDFAFFLESSVAGEIEIASPDFSLDYQELSDIKLLSSLTDGGYDVLGSFTGLDVTYEKYIKNSDLKEEYYMQTNVHFTESYQDEKYKYGSIDSQTVSTPKTTTKTSEGVFIDTNGYHERMYDQINKKHNENVDKAESPYTVYDMMSMVATSISGERLLSQDIFKVTVTEDAERIVFKYVYTSDAVILYSEYLLSAFTGNTSGIDLSKSKIYVNKSEGEITVRKSDGCLIKHTVDFSVLVEGAITLESKTTLTVNATGDSIDVLTLSDWEKKYPRTEEEAA